MSNQVEEIQDIPKESDAYINYYGLSGDPFDGEDAAFFSTPQLEKALRLFNYLARFSRKVVVVTGDEGAGKTTLLDRFISQQSEQDVICCFNALETDTPKQVLHEVAEQFGADIDETITSVDQLQNSIREFALSKEDEGRVCLVLVDDAHLFNQDVISQLYLLAAQSAQGRSPVHLLLFGEDALIEKTRLEIPPEEDKRAVFHQLLNALSFDESVQYLHMCFSENAGQSKPPFSDADYSRIYQASRGFPGAINQTSREVLMEGVDRLVSTGRNSKSIWGVALIGCLILAVLAATYLWHDERIPTSVTEVESNNSGTVLRAVERAEVVSVDDENNQAKNEVAQAVVEDTPELEPVIEDHAVKDDGDDSETVIAVNPAIEADAKLEALEVEKESQASQEKGESELEVSSSTASVIAPALQPVETSQVDQPKKPTVETSPKAEEIQTGSTTAIDRFEQAILELGRSDYTMQLLGSRTEEGVAKLLQRLPGDNNLRYFRTEHKGKPWYVLIYGNYPSRDVANAAAKNLPTELADVKPWVRNVGAIQDAISSRPTTN